MVTSVQSVYFRVTYTCGYLIDSWRALLRLWQRQQPVRTLAFSSLLHQFLRYNGDLPVRRLLTPVAFGTQHDSTFLLQVLRKHACFFCQRQPTHRDKSLVALVAAVFSNVTPDGH